jgi:hypothetical protein
VTLIDDGGTANGGVDRSTQTFTIAVHDVTAPTVTDVIIRWGSQSASLLSILDSGRTVLSFLNINAIDIVFSEDVGVAQANLLLQGLAGAYGFTGFSYDAGTFTARWDLQTGLGGTSGIDRLMLSLDGQSALAVRDRHGNALNGGSDFTRRFDVLVGDYDGNGVVDRYDRRGIRDAFTSSYSGINFADLDGDGVVDRTDLRIARKHRRNRLP